MRRFGFAGTALLGPMVWPSRAANPNRGSSGCRWRVRPAAQGCPRNPGHPLVNKFPRVCPCFLSPPRTLFASASADTRILSSFASKNCSHPAASTGIRQQPISAGISSTPFVGHHLRSIHGVCDVCGVPAAKAISEKEPTNPAPGFADRRTNDKQLGCCLANSPIWRIFTL